MRIAQRLRTLNEAGFDHFFLAVFVVVIFGIVGSAYLVYTRATNSTYYNGSCAAVTDKLGSSGTCVQQGQILLDALQHQEVATGHSYRTATAPGAGVFRYGSQYYLVMNGSYNTATQTAVHRLYGNNVLTGGTSSSAGWQVLCSAAAQYGFSTNSGAGANKLVFARTAGEYTSNPVYVYFLGACGSKVAIKSPTPPPTTGGGSTSTGGGSTTSSSGTGFITASGTQLMQNGKPYKSIGFNFSAVGACWSGTNWTTAQMDTFFSNLPSDSMARFFAPSDNTNSATYVESVVHEADKYNIHLIVALADDDVDNNCDTENSANNGRTTAFYTSAPQSGSTWYNWAKSVVTPLANDPGVAIWEIGNEAFHNGASIGQVGTANAEYYVNQSAADIRSFETAGAGGPKQLITVAPADIGEFGGVSGMEDLFKNLDVVDDHDYSADADPGSPAVNAEFSSLEQAGKALNKPYMVDEAGVEGGSCSAGPYNAWDNGSGGLSLANRVSFLVNQKATNYFNNGASGINFWLYTGNGGGCSYENIYPGDPIMAAVRGYQIP